MKPLCSVCLQYRRFPNFHLHIAARVMLGMFKRRQHGSPARDLPLAGAWTDTVTSSLASSTALGSFQAICFGKDPLGHLEKNHSCSRGFSLTLADLKAVIGQEMGTHLPVPSHPSWGDRCP